MPAMLASQTGRVHIPGRQDLDKENCKKEYASMKKLITVLCVIAVLLSLSAVAFAAEDTQASQQGQAPSDGPQMDGQRPSGPPDRIDFEDMVSKGVISQETCDKIKAYLEEHKPTDLPEMDGQRPEMNGQAPDGEAPADLPEPPQMNGRPPQTNDQTPSMGNQPPQMNGQAPSMGDQPPQMNGQVPSMNGQPPQMDGQTPSGDAPSDLSEPPDMNGEAPEMNGEAPAKGGLLKDLLNDGIITQAEYDALCEAISK